MRVNKGSSEEDSMADAKALLEEIQKELQAVTEQLLRHPYVQAGGRKDRAGESPPVRGRAVRHYWKRSEKRRSPGEPLRRLAQR